MAKSRNLEVGKLILMKTLAIQIDLIIILSSNVKTSGREEVEEEALARDLRETLIPSREAIRIWIAQAIPFLPTTHSPL